MNSGLPDGSIAEEIGIPTAEVSQIIHRMTIPQYDRRDYFEFDRRDEPVKFFPGKLADALTGYERVLTLRDTHEIYFCSDGCYRPNGEVWIQEKVGHILGSYFQTITSHQLNEVVTHLRVRTREDYTVFSRDPNLLPLKNGMFDLATGTLKRYDTGAFRFDYQLPVSYNPDATCPNIDEFIEDITLTKVEAQRLFELPAFCMSPEYFVKKGWMLCGDGDNAKTTYLRTMTSFLGPENCSSVSLQDLVSNRFATAELRGKLANIYDDLQSRALKDTGKFKVLTGGSYADYEVKYGGRGKFLNMAKLIFSCNQIPDASEDSTAFFTRWEIQDFPILFVVGLQLDVSTKLCKPAKDRERLISSLTTIDELSGLLNKAIPILARLREQGSFTASKAVDEVRAQYIQKSNSLKAFGIEKCVLSSEVGKDLIVRKQDFMDAYHAYCSEKGLPKKLANVVGLELPTLFPHANIRPGRTKVIYGEHLDRQEQAWYGIDLKDGWKERVAAHEERKKSLESFTEDTGEGEQ